MVERAEQNQLSGFATGSNPIEYAKCLENIRDQIFRSAVKATTREANVVCSPA